MTLSEFKAWFEGFTENMEGPPDGKQWDKIQKRIKKIDGVTVTERVFVNRYWDRRPWHDEQFIARLVKSNATLSVRSRSASVGRAMFASERSSAAVEQRAFDSHSAMLALGKADAASLKAAA